MEILKNVLVLVHMVGMACIIGGWLSLRARSVGSGPGLSLVVWGARFQILTGVALVGILESLDEPINHAKIGLKLAVALAVAASAEMAAARARRGSEPGPAKLIDAAGALAVVNMAIAIFV